MQEVKMILKKILDCGLFFGGPLAVIFMYASLNYSGFCFDKMRYLGQEEKFRILFEIANQLDTISVKTEDRGLQDYKTVKYENFEQFMETNPGCCAIEPGGPYELPPPRFFDRITGYHSGEVIVIKYTFDYLDENDRKILKKYRDEIVLQNCGRVKYWN
jgi:hypothetical protein